MITSTEKAAIDCHRDSVDPMYLPDSIKSEVALFLGIRMLLEAGQLVRENRSRAYDSGITIKNDGSPATEIEEQIETRLRAWLKRLDSEAVVVGEETGGVLPSRGTAIAIDPIDGTRAFLAETETYSTTLAVIRDGVVALGMVSNPVTGEIAYATASGSSRLLRISVFGEPDTASPLPTRTSDSGPMLVNMHPNSRASRMSHSLYQAWECGQIKMVRSPGGSPAWALVEAARGHFLYCNLWSKRRAEIYDLAAGTIIVRRAGGEVLDLQGRPIEALHHQGAFVAGVDRRQMSKLLKLLKEHSG